MIIWLHLFTSSPLQRMKRTKDRAITACRDTTKGVTNRKWFAGHFLFRILAFFISKLNISEL
jgi:hypothetical protein